MLPANNPNPQKTENLPLQGRQILITRPANQGPQLAQLLEKVGATPVLHPVIAIRPPSDWRPIDNVIERLNEFDRLVFVSVNGVAFFLDRCSHHKIPAQSLKKHRIAAIGKRTVQTLAAKGLEVDLVPERQNSAALADLLIAKTEGERLLLVRADRGSAELPDRLTSAQLPFEQIAVYQSVDVTTPQPPILEQLGNGDIAWVTITSSAIARATVNLFGDALKQVPLVSISPNTSRQLKALGYHPTAEATRYNMEGVVEAIIEWETQEH